MGQNINNEPHHPRVVQFKHQRLWESSDDSLDEDMEVIGGDNWRTSTGHPYDIITIEHELDVEDPSEALVGRDGNQIAKSRPVKEMLGQKLLNLMVIAITACLTLMKSIIIKGKQAVETTIDRIKQPIC